MQHRVASRPSVAFGIVFALVAMALSFLAVLAATKVQAQSAAQAQYAQATSAECDNTQTVRTFSGSRNQTTEPFQIRGDKFRLAYQTERTGNNPRLEVTVFEDGRSTGQSFVARNGADGNKIIPLGPGSFQLEIQANNVRYSVTVEDCLGANASNTDQITTAQTTTAQTTTAQTTSPSTTTAADALQQGEAAGNADRSADFFRCEEFLHVVRDEQGALRAQYQDNELIMRRFEQCLSADVLANTIPRRLLPGTGGVSLLGLAAIIGLASLVAGAFVLRAALRRER